MATWKNLDTLASFDKLCSLKNLIIVHQWQLG